MSAEPSPTERFARAIRTRQVNEAMIVATELRDVGLSAALDLCVLLAAAGDHRFPRAASRWLGRFISERQVDLPRALEAAAALAGLQNATTRQRCADRLAILITKPGG